MPFVLEVPVDDQDIDELGHASNVSYVRWVQEAAVCHSAALGWGMAAYLARGQAFVVRRHEVDYLRPAFLGDQLAVETRVVSLRGASSVRQTLIRRPASGELLLRARTGWAFVDLRSGRPSRIPADISDCFPIEQPEEEPGGLQRPL